MARSYAKLMVSIWDADDDFRDLNANAQRLYMALFSSPRLSAAGVLPLQVRQWARLAPDTTERHITKALAELEAHPSRKIIVDRDTDEVFVRAHIRTDGGANNMHIATSIRRAIDSIESDGLREAANAELARALGHEPEPPSGGSSEGASEGACQGSSEGARQATAPPPKPLTTPSTYTADSRQASSVELVLVNGHELTSATEDEGFQSFWSMYPRKVGKPAALRVWKAKVQKPHLDGEVLFTGLDRWCTYWDARNEPEYVPHPSTWLNEERWNDTPPPPPGRKQAPGMARLRELYDEAVSHEA